MEAPTTPPIIDTEEEGGSEPTEYVAQGVLDLLLEMLPNLQEALGRKDTQGASPFHWAASSGNLHSLRALCTAYSKFSVSKQTYPNIPIYS